METLKNKEILPLTSLRFFAAAIVIIAHLGYDYHLGGMGVTFFFILSGFILSYNYATKFIDWSSRQLISMWISRVSRIYPVHIFMFILSLPLSYIYAREYSVTDTLSNILLIQSWYPNGQGTFSYNGVSWTLSCELFFYLTLPFVLFACSRKALQIKTTQTLIVMMLIMLIIWLVSLSAGHDIVEYSFKWWFYIISPYLRWMDFLFGIALGYTFLKGKSVRPTWPNLFSLLEVLSLTSIVGFYFYFLHAELPYKWNYSAYFNPLFGAIIYTFAFQNGLLSKLLSMQALTYLGRISFSIYMTHQVLIFYWNRYIVNLNYIASTIEEAINQILYCAAVIFMSSFIYHVIENPARRAIHKLTLRPY
ncbi:acyltransferase family protein [Enterobacter ludwigii]